ncbi:MAG: AtpZ/AtpI family protein [Hyphomonadaceae bacterium]|jgi:ATP synthase protein I|nr:AtpZ/AtpI family protein [Hyphomonadaceae bacterium]
MADQHPSPADDALETLSRKVAAAQASHAPEAEPDPNRSNGMALGMRMASELVSAIAVGTLLGYGLDWLLKSSPWGLLVGLGFGFAAGVVNVVRSAQRISAGVPIGNDMPASSDEAGD